MSNHDPYAPHDVSTKKETKKVEDKVPEGTAVEVLNWVGDDPKKAQKAIDAENKEDKPRKTLLKSLKEIIDNA